MFLRFSLSLFYKNNWVVDNKKSSVSFSESFYQVSFESLNFLAGRASENLFFFWKNIFYPSRYPHWNQLLWNHNFLGRMLHCRDWIHFPSDYHSMPLEYFLTRWFVFCEKNYFGFQFPFSIDLKTQSYFICISINVVVLFFLIFLCSFSKFISCIAHYWVKEKLSLFFVRSTLTFSVKKLPFSSIQLQ